MPPPSPCAPSAQSVRGGCRPRHRWSDGVAGVKKVPPVRSARNLRRCRHVRGRRGPSRVWRRPHPGRIGTDGIGRFAPPAKVVMPGDGKKRGWLCALWCRWCMPLRTVTNLVTGFGGEVPEKAGAAAYRVSERTWRRHRRLFRQSRLQKTGRKFVPIRSLFEGALVHESRHREVGVD